MADGGFMRFEESREGKAEIKLRRKNTEIKLRKSANSQFS